MTQYDPIADELRAHILNGTYPPGTAIPSENRLCHTYQCENGTVRRALRVLQSEGLILKTQGRPTIVAPVPNRTTLTLPSGCSVTARMPMRPELDTLGCTAATPLLVVTSTGSPPVPYPADRILLLSPGTRCGGDGDITMPVPAAGVVIGNR
ncbi:GntR family transcriptional regulator [Dactylosporangium sp. NPDC051485]|uniref:GntR family transcriptional regulator n=1 Tax=Dactylosporangium sp. NPDC051485 TaxID=3154846 RepID=UPI0034340FEC